jgi:hypothetical protein
MQSASVNDESHDYTTDAGLSSFVIPNVAEPVHAMPDQREHSHGADLRSLVQAAEKQLDGPPTDRLPAIAAEIRGVLATVEEQTPGGAPLHAQLDNVRKWLDALARPADHDRFGGANHLREYVITQLRLTLGALEDYQREMR